MHSPNQTVKPDPAPCVAVFAIFPPLNDFFRQYFDPRLFPQLSCHWLELSDMSPERWEELLFKLNPTILFTGWGTSALPDGFVDSKDISLRYVCHLTGAFKGLVPRRLIERGVVVSNWGQAISYTIAEHAILLVLASLRSLPKWPEYINRWETFSKEDLPSQALSTRSLRGKRVGLHGFGAIAREIARMLEPFRVQITAYSPGVPSSLYEECRVKQAGSLEDLFATSDVLIECEAVTSQTKGTVTERILRLLPENAVFVNVGRAAVVDEAALIKIGLEGRLRIALDVYEHEPISTRYPLWNEANVLLSPHIAGPTEDALPVLGQFAFENLHRFLKGNEIEGLISLEVYDRAT